MYLWRHRVRNQGKKRMSQIECHEADLMALQRDFIKQDWGTHLRQRILFQCLVHMKGNVSSYHLRFRYRTVWPISDEEGIVSSFYRSTIIAILYEPSSKRNCHDYVAHMLEQYLSTVQHVGEPWIQKEPSQSLANLRMLLVQLPFAVIEIDTSSALHV